MNRTSHLLANGEIVRRCGVGAYLGDDARKFATNYFGRWKGEASMFVCRMKTAISTINGQAKILRVPYGLLDSKPHSVP